jgi:hypothetical protein
MPDALFAPVFTAEARALLSVLDAERSNGQDRDNSSRLKAMMKALLPGILETPARMKRLNNALVDWLMAEPRTGREVDATRAEFAEVLETQAGIMSRVRDVAISMELPTATLDHLSSAMDEVERIRTAAFQHWEPFTKDDYEAAMSELRQGEAVDLDEVILELQGGAQ